MFEEKLGGKIADRFTRAGIPDENFYLRELAQHILALPYLGLGAKPVWVALHRQTNLWPGLQKPTLGRALCAEYEIDSERLGRLMKLLIEVHISTIPNRDAAGFARRRAIVNQLNAGIDALAGTDQGFRNRARLLHRMARYNGDVVKWLIGFFFHGMPLEESGIPRGFWAKMRSIIRQDIAHLIRFLKALIGDHVRQQRNGSPLRLKLAAAAHWPAMVKRQRAGIPESEFFAEVEQRAGLVAPTTESLQAPRLVAFAKRRARLKLQYPK